MRTALLITALMGLVMVGLASCDDADSTTCITRVVAGAATIATDSITVTGDSNCVSTVYLGDSVGTDTTPSGTTTTYSYDSVGTDPTPGS